MGEDIISKRLMALREVMKEKQIDVYIIPSSDPHLSEYPADHWKAREWMSGFSGSAGTLVVTMNNAGLWTDSRYFLQAAIQLEGTTIDLYKTRLPETPTLTEFLTAELQAGQTVGLDGYTYSISDTLRLKKILSEKNILIESSFDLVGMIWTDRPEIPGNQIFEMPTEISGKTTIEKLHEINDFIKNRGTDCLILTALDDIAWTFNIRGTDIAYNPVAISYGFVSEEESILFINPKKQTKEITDRLTKEGVKIMDYTQIETFLSKLSKTRSIYIDKSKTNTTLFHAIPSECKIIEGLTPANHLKSIKNETEIKGFRHALVKDGIALTKFFFWLEKKIKSGEIVTEISTAEKLSSLRSEQQMYLMDSFNTICGYAEHGAIVHYSATTETDAVIKPGSLLLIDSGAQYLEGTTDITRTIALGEPTEQMKKDFTRVLKGHISLAKCRFPENTRGSQLDILARKALWDAGINYLHGTGHGIGHCLNVHEGPQNIRMEENSTVLTPGMVTSNEPGIYRTGEYGIRIENMTLVREDCKTDWGTFLGFETLTLCYIDTSLVITEMLSTRERSWLNKYHQMVYEQLSPFLDKAEQKWLREKTEEI